MATVHISPEDFVCPVPLADYPNVLLGHGSGGKMTNRLISYLFMPAFDNDALGKMNDQAVVSHNGTRIAITTDSFVVSPIFFPGGDIGSLAVHGTVNDLAVGGAKPLWMAAAFIIEEGLPMAELNAVVAGAARAAREAGVTLVTGDTKVVNRGKGDKVFITTTGVGIVPDGVELSAENCGPGDVIILSGPIGRHGIAILSVREGIDLETDLESDSAALNGLVQVMLAASRGGIRTMRDPTRGGVSSALNEIAGASKVGMALDEQAIPIPDAVRGACEMLGLDPLYVANEGVLLAIVALDQAEEVLGAMRAHPLGADAAIVGEVTEDHPGVVVLKSSIGGTRVVDMLAGEQLPRIC